MAKLPWQQLLLLWLFGFVASFASAHSSDTTNDPTVARAQPTSWWSPYWAHPYPPPKCWYGDSGCLKEVLQHGGAKGCREHLDHTVTKTESSRTVLSTITTTTTLRKGSTLIGTVTATITSTDDQTTTTTSITTETSGYTSVSTIDAAASTTVTVTSISTSTIETSTLPGLATTTLNRRDNCPQCDNWYEYRSACSCLGVQPSTTTVTKWGSTPTTIRTTVTHTVGTQPSTVVTTTRTVTNENTATVTEVDTTITSAAAATSTLTTTDTTTTITSVAATRTTIVGPPGDSTYIILLTYPTPAVNPPMYGQIGGNFFDGTLDPSFFYGVEDIENASTFAYDSNTGFFYNLDVFPGYPLSYEDEKDGFVVINFPPNAGVSFQVPEISCEIQADNSLECAYSGYSTPGTFATCKNALVFLAPGVTSGCSFGAYFANVGLSVLPVLATP